MPVARNLAATPQEMHCCCQNDGTLSTGKDGMKDLRSKEGSSLF